MVIGVALLKDHQGQGELPGLPGHPAPAGRVEQTPYVPPAQPAADASTEWRIPENAPVDRDGDVHLTCSGGHGFIAAVRPGSVVTCPAGAIPVLSG